MKIRLKMTVFGGRVARDFYVHDDKSPGGYDRMVQDALRQANESGYFPRGSTLNILSNWTKP